MSLILLKISALNRTLPFKGISSCYLPSSARCCWHFQLGQNHELNYSNVKSRHYPRTFGRCDSCWSYGGARCSSRELTEAHKIVSLLFFAFLRSSSCFSVQSVTLYYATSVTAAFKFATGFCIALFRKRSFPHIFFPPFFVYNTFCIVLYIASCIVHSHIVFFDNLYLQSLQCWQFVAGFYCATEAFIAR